MNTGITSTRLAPKPAMAAAMGNTENLIMMIVPAPVAIVSRDRWH
jgi:hypothetical protein